MQNWSWLIVPVTMFVLFVVSQLMKREENKQRQRKMQAPKREPSEPRAEDDRSEMQKFLDEVQRMRERAEQKKQETMSPWSPPVARPAPVVEARPAPRATPRPQPRQRLVTPAPEPQEVLEVLAVDTEMRSRSTKPAAIVDRRRASSPAARDMLVLLQSPRSLATAWLLKEVLDRPLSMRISR